LVKSHPHPYKLGSNKKTCISVSAELLANPKLDRKITYMN